MRITKQDLEEMLRRPERLDGVGNLMLARHGDYDEDTGDLTEAGRKEMQALAEVLERQDLKLAIVSSVATRAVQSAGIIGDFLGQAPIQTEVLGNELGRSRIPPQAMWSGVKALVPNAPDLLLITHAPLIIPLGEFCLQRAGMEDPERCLYSAMQGQAFWMNTPAGVVSVLNEPD